jgi:tetratricopeptide (TPR) repeat protein
MRWWGAITKPERRPTVDVAARKTPITMPQWTAFPHDAAAYRYDAAGLTKAWPRLHAGDAEPLPAATPVLAAWQLFHAGQFERAVAAGLQAADDGAPAGLTVANKAQAIYATCLEASESAKQALFLEVAQRAEARAAQDPRDANAWYSIAYALGRYSQSVSVARALALGLGGKVRHALETTLRLSPKHADAHIALGSFHAEVIDKVGALLGLTQGASKDAGLASYRAALKLNPRSAIAMIEYAKGMVMLEGEKRMPEATRLYEAAAASEPLDAAERLDVEMAKAELED